MFSPFRPKKQAIERGLEIAAHMPLSCVLFNTQRGPDDMQKPQGCAIDHTRTRIGYGMKAFHAARAAFQQWQQFHLGWVRVANPQAVIKTDQIVAVEAHALGLWSVNFSRIVYLVDEPTQFGFGYATTTLHVERGEERFLLEFSPESGAVYYDLLAVSQPAHWMAKLAYPYIRSRQRKFARDSHQRMRQIAGNSA